ncbi:DUF3169 family protein [Hungatella effluvii]|uniref:DUF3169 family protein n=1 Tax=Hungatella effluvii TaxID=1096246 RepID=UPI002A7F7C97|nr:DUF3169 family protein [Hungatella effluvii]
MKVKNSYLKLMLWTLSGAAIGAGLGAGSILFAKGRAASLAELLYVGAVRSALWIQLIVWLVLGGCSLVLMNKAKKWSPLMDSDEEGVTEKKVGNAQNTVLTLTNVNLVIQFMAFGIGFDKRNTFALLSVVVFLVSTISMVCVEIAVIKQVKKTNPLKKGDPADLSFLRTWEESCDEAERLQIYRCGYKAFQITRHSLLFGLVIAFIGKINMGTGSMSILLLGLIMLIQSISYGFYSLREGKGLRE